MSPNLVRPPGVSFCHALSAQFPSPSIQVDLARQQHTEYCAALRAAGAELIRLPPDENYPDACFVQDTAVVWSDLAVVARFGVPSRQGEQETIRQVLQAHKRVVEIQPPATLEGGDVLAIGSHFFVGLSARTNRAGFAQLRDWLEPEGATVRPLPVPAGLHLLTGCSYLGRGVVLAAPDWADLPIWAGLDLICVPREEAYAANALAVGASVILAAGCPQTAAQLRGRGFEVLPVPLSEFAKADGGVTCLSLPF